jgi:glycosyltransferase involved in cell wall biosynthesis
MGGAETWLMAVLKFFAQHDLAQMDFLATSGRPGVFDDEARGLGAKVHYMPYGRAHLADFTRDFRALLRREKYDAIHDHGDYSSGFHFLCGLGCLPPVRVTHIHNAWLHMEVHYGVSGARRMTARAGKFLVEQLATHVCGTSHDTLVQYGFAPGARRRPKSAVLHCGFDVGRFSVPRDSDRAAVRQEFGWPADARIVLFVGRLDRALAFDHPQNQKNSWLALNAVKEAALRDPSICLLMVGDGASQILAMERHAADWGLADRLRFLGIRKDVPRLMRGADMLFFPSRQEGLGMVAVEAQAAGIPVLASTEVPPAAVVIPELYHTVALDAPLSAWTDALFKAMATPSLPLDQVRARMQASAFSIETSATRLLAIYGGQA